MNYFFRLPSTRLVLISPLTTTSQPSQPPYCCCCAVYLYLFCLVVVRVLPGWILFVATHGLSLSPHPPTAEKKKEEEERILFFCLYCPASSSSSRTLELLNRFLKNTLLFVHCVVSGVFWFSFVFDDEDVHQSAAVYNSS